MKKGTKLYGAGDLVQYLLDQPLPDETITAIRRREEQNKTFRDHMDEVRAAMRQVADASD